MSSSFTLVYWIGLWSHWSLSPPSTSISLDFMVLCKCSLQIILTSLYLVEGLAWCDWPLTWWTDHLQCFDTVGRVIWPVKIVPDMTYNVFGGTLNPTRHFIVQRASSALALVLVLKQPILIVSQFPFEQHSSNSMCNIFRQKFFPRCKASVWKYSRYTRLFNMTARGRCYWVIDSRQLINKDTSCWLTIAAAAAQSAYVLLLCVTHAYSIQSDQYNVIHTANSCL